MASDSETHDGRKLARGWYDAWAEFDMERLQRLLAPDFVHVSPLGRLAGRDHYLATVEPMARRSVAELIVHEMVAGADAVAVRFTNRTPEGDVESCDWIRIRDGRIAEVRSFYDAEKVRDVLDLDRY